MPNNWIRNDCTVEKGWSKDDPYYVIINMELNTNDINTKEGQLPDVFVVSTFLKTEDKCISEKTSFLSSEAGLAIALQKIWPIILGVFISTLIVGTIVYVVVKNGYINKLRHFNNKMENTYDKSL